MDYDEREVVYFRNCREVNTEKVLHVVKSRCKELELNTVAIASETGTSAIKALNVFKGTSIGMIVVTHYPATTWDLKARFRLD